MAVHMCAKKGFQAKKLYGKDPDEFLFWLLTFDDIMFKKVGEGDDMVIKIYHGKDRINVKDGEWLVWDEDNNSVVSHTNKSFHMEYMIQ